MSRKGRHRFKFRREEIGWNQSKIIVTSRELRYKTHKSPDVIASEINVRKAEVEKGMKALPANCHQKPLDAMQKLLKNDFEGDRLASMAGSACLAISHPIMLSSLPGSSSQPGPHLADHPVAWDRGRRCGSIYRGFTAYTWHVENLPFWQYPGGGQPPSGC